MSGDVHVKFERDRDGQFRGALRASGTVAILVVIVVGLMGLAWIISRCLEASATLQAASGPYAVHCVQNSNAVYASELDEAGVLQALGRSPPA